MDQLEINRGIKAGEEINGSCVPIPDGYIENGTVDFLQGFDSVTRQCGCCGWWCDASDVNEHDECKECAG